jgi:hypothetical protein
MWKCVINITPFLEIKNQIRVGKVRIVTKGGKKNFCYQNIENVLLIIKKE